MSDSNHANDVIESVLSLAKLSVQESAELRRELSAHYNHHRHELANSGHPAENIHESICSAWGNPNNAASDFNSLLYNRFLLRLNIIGLVLMILSVLTAFIIWWQAMGGINAQGMFTIWSIAQH